jgi:hypothetical protein
MDIFADFKPQPKLYIADVTVSFDFKTRKNSKTLEKNTITLEKIPIVLNGKEFPTKRTEHNFMKRVFSRHGKGSFENANMRLVKIENCKLTSKLAYKFDYNVH